MLQINYIRENKAAVINGLTKKYFADAEQIVNEIIEIDQIRRDTQHNLDLMLAEANSKAKAIGDLMKAGKKEEAEKEKATATELRTKTKELQDLHTIKEEELNMLLLKLPNLPHYSVPEGRTAEENLNIYSNGE
ncbi:MAG TPA: hypothetical protein VK796_00360, partial [Cytophaga sp.]|nr:hypothetical protein [Cytophaga sp.]